MCLGFLRKLTPNLNPRLIFSKEMMVEFKAKAKTEQRPELSVTISNLSNYIKVANLTIMPTKNKINGIIYDSLAFLHIIFSRIR